MNQAHRELKNLIGGWAYRALKQGRPLIVWRRSSPHHWFIEDSRNQNTLWHSDDYDRKLPNLDLFEKKSDSKNCICSYWGADSGMSEETRYYLKTPDQQ